MNDMLASELLKICNVLNEKDVRYLIIGGTAVAFYGHVRLTIDSFGLPSEKYDFDFWYNPSYENYFNLLAALELLGLDVSEFKSETAPNPKKSFFKFETENCSIDFLPEIPGLTRFSSSYAQREDIDLNGVDISFIGYEDLILNKRANARAKDISDIEQLESKRTNEQ